MLRLVLVGARENAEQRLEGLEVAPLDGSLDQLLHAMIARNERRIGEPHPRRARRGLEVVPGDALAPGLRPVVEGAGLGEQRGDLRVRRRVGRRSAEAAKKTV